MRAERFLPRAWLCLEIALTRDRAELISARLAKEQDRLRVLLEVNNHVVTKLDITELLRAASASIRGYFRNDFTGFWRSLSANRNA